MKIAVLAGGYSHERNVSLSSGSQIANALRTAGHRVVLIDCYLGIPDGECPPDPDPLFLDESSGEPYAYEIAEEEPDLAALKRAAGIGDALIGNHVVDICRAADVTFIALHGGMGENGQLQATLDVLGIRYTGSMYTGCVLAMDKVLAKQQMRFAGVDTPEWVDVHPEDTQAHFLAKTDEVTGYPCVVKPCGNGSSIGVFMVDRKVDLPAAVEKALTYDDHVMIERKVAGREFSVGILDGQPLPVIEIVPLTGFYDYANKYQPSRAKEICPADLPDAVAQSMQKDALRVGNVLRLSSYYRVDFMMEEDGSHYCLEANNLPGMTPSSLIPMEAAAIGISYSSLCDRIVQLALSDRSND